MKIIDAHVHLVHHPAGLDRLVESGVFGEMWVMDLSGIGRLGEFELATRSELLEISRRYPGFFRLFGFLNLDHEGPDMVARLRDQGFVGLKVYKQRNPYGDPAYFPVYAKAAELGMPILFHTGLIARHTPWNGAETAHAYGAENMRPSHLAGIAEAFPALKIIAGHIGWPWIEETEQNLYFYPNITGDISGYRRILDRFPELLDRLAHDGTGRFFNQKLHFATDQFYGVPEQNETGMKLVKFWQYYFELIGGTYYRWGQPEEREKFFRANALDIFKNKEYL